MRKRSSSKAPVTQHKFKKAKKARKVLSEEEKKARDLERRTYNGFVYRSGLEVECAKQLDAAGLKYEYEKHTYTLLEPFTCNNLVMVHKEGKRKGKKYKVFEESREKCESISYTPDFVNIDEGWIIETKGLRVDKWIIIEKLFKKYMVDHNISFDFYAPSTDKEIAQVIELIKLRKQQKNKKVA